MSIKETKNQPQPFDLPTELLLLENKRAEIKAQQGVVLKESEYLKNLREERRNKLAPLQRKIKKGEISTGDKIKDFCLVYLAEKPEEAKKLQEIENQMKKHKGQFILFDAMIQDKEAVLTWKQDLKIGVIDNKTPLDTEIRTGWLVFSKKHLHSHKYEPSGFRYSPNFLLLHKDELMFVGKSIKEVDEKKLGGVTLKIIIGSKKVYKYFKSHPHPDVSDEFVRDLGILSALKKIVPEAKDSKA